MEAIFTASRGWATLLRATLLDVRVELCAKYAAVHKPNLHSMLAWWPINLQDPGAAEEDEAAPRGPGGVRRTSATHFLLPVIVEKRHLPTGERARPEENHYVEEVSVTNPFPRAHWDCALSWLPLCCCKASSHVYLRSLRRSWRRVEWWRVFLK